jgi:hypothetical protein
MRKIFAAKSEVSSQNQKDMFFVFNDVTDRRIGSIP